VFDKIKNFFLASYQSDRIAFYFEMASLISTVIGSTMLSFTADEPQMEYIYPLFFIGTSTALVSYYRRKIVIPMLLMIYFTFANVHGFFVAMEMI
jgi:hypothetical protein